MERWAPKPDSILSGQVQFIQYDRATGRYTCSHWTPGHWLMFSDVVVGESFDMYAEKYLVRVADLEMDPGL